MYLILLIDKLPYTAFSDSVPTYLDSDQYLSISSLPDYPGSGGLASTNCTTQGDPLAMAMYALAVLSLIHRLQSAYPAVSQVWYADDATGVGTCSFLRKWWDTLSKLRSLFGYNPNALKTYLLVKNKYAAVASALLPVPALLSLLMGKGT